MCGSFLAGPTRKWREKLPSFRWYIGPEERVVGRRGGGALALPAGRATRMGAGKSSNLQKVRHNVRTERDRPSISQYAQDYDILQRWLSAGRLCITSTKDTIRNVTHETRILLRNSATVP